MPHSVEGERWTDEQRAKYLEGMTVMVESLWWDVIGFASFMRDAGEITQAKLEYLINPRCSTSCPLVDNADERQCLEVLRALHDRMAKRMEEEMER